MTPCLTHPTHNGAILRLFIKAQPTSRGIEYPQLAVRQIDRITIGTKNFRRIQNAVNRTRQISYCRHKTSRHSVARLAERKSNDCRFLIGSNRSSAESTDKWSPRFRHAQPGLIDDAATDYRNTGSGIYGKHERARAVDPPGRYKPVVLVT
jgi:hypothetical protein